MKFGELKCKIIATLTEEYSKNNKENISKILKLINEDKEFKELYLFYEDFENLTIKNPKQYLSNLTNVLNEKFDKIKETSNKIEKLIPKDIVFEYNNIYEGLDLLTVNFNLNNIVNKNESIELLENHLSSDKITINEDTEQIFTENEKLLKTILVNNFNVLYETNLNDDEKVLFKEIVNINENELKEKFTTLKDEILSKLDDILNEHDNNLLKDKINEVKNEVLLNKDINRINYLKLKEFSNEFI